MASARGMSQRDSLAEEGETCTATSLLGLGGEVEHCGDVAMKQ